MEGGLDFARVFDRIAPDTDRGDARGYFERAGLTEWYDKLIERL